MSKEHRALFEEALRLLARAEFLLEQARVNHEKMQIIRYWVCKHGQHSFKHRCIDCDAEMYSTSEQRGQRHA